MGDTLGELLKCKTSKIYPITKHSCQVRHICPPSLIPETLPWHVQPSGQTCSAPLPNPGSRDLTRTCSIPRPDMSGLSVLSWVNQAYPASRPGSEAFPGHVWSNPISQWLSPGPDISRPHASFQRGWSYISGFLILQQLDSLGAPHVSLARLVTYFILQTLWYTLLSSQSLSSKLHSNPNFLGDIWASLLSDSLDLHLKHFTDDLHVFITLGDLFP
jgi:hypothetical protein